ncbi:MAG: hypothetical protein LM566_01415 [Pyrobaculum sp.]|nr:hypothetical protein [Pyrobaculum sp.]MCC6067334.1 hypothetical protein [Pyrobaculum sp.]
MEKIHDARHFGVDSQRVEDPPQLGFAGGAGPHSGAELRSSILSQFFTAREYVVEITLSVKQTLDAAGALFVVHVFCATATAAAVPCTLKSHVATPVAYLAVKSRRLEKA